VELVEGLEVDHGPASIALSGELPAHMQHILTKLGLTNRTQVAGWYRSRPPRQD